METRYTYNVTKEFMDALIKWRDDNGLEAHPLESFSSIDYDTLEDLPTAVREWWRSNLDPRENNNRLITIIRWLNGEDVFHLAKEKQYIVRSNEPDHNGKYSYISVVDGTVKPIKISFDNVIESALIFPTYELARLFCEPGFGIHTLY